MNNTKVMVGVIVVVALLVGWFVFFKGGSSPVSGAAAAGNASTITNQFVFTSGIQVGSASTNRTVINGVIATTCTGIVYQVLQATSTLPFDCTVTGSLTTAKFVGFGSPVLIQQIAASSTSLVLWGGHASTTAGTVSGYITNLTGISTSSYAQATTSIPVLIIQ